jgi:hypothetical protein
MAQQHRHAFAWRHDVVQPVAINITNRDKKAKFSKTA